MMILEGVILLIYAALMLFIFAYSLVQASLLRSYLRSRRGKGDGAAAEKPAVPKDGWPHVTVQLPVYNELYVAGRLLDAVAALDYPADRLEIQVLDDSTDETTALLASKVALLAAQGVHVTHVRRDKREGYKAGALANGTKLARGEFIAIFDADFVPGPDFLRRTVPGFGDPRVGVVQTRWGHLNRSHSLLTELQAFGLDAHFTVEQSGRHAGGHFINFNGTAGVWRKRCIEDAGGWKPDTLTEDLDLSYRAQLRRWKFVYDEDTVSPAELPVTMSALRSQQFRWTKGAAETARRNLGSVLSLPGITNGTRINAFFHLTNSFIFVCVAVTALLSVPVLYFKNSGSAFASFFDVAGVFLLSFLILVVFYRVSALRTGQALSFPFFLRRFFLFLSVSMGLSLHNAIAVAEGYLGRKTPFIRTPKHNVTGRGSPWRGSRYLRERIGLINIIEGLLVFYFAAGMWMAFSFGDFGLFPFHLMLTAGFGLVFYMSVSHALLSREAVVRGTGRTNMKNNKNHELS